MANLAGNQDNSGAASKESSKDLVMITTTLKTAEMSKVTYEEFPNYTKEALVADIGGALGGVKLT